MRVDCSVIARVITSLFPLLDFVADHKTTRHRTIGVMISLKYSYENQHLVKHLIFLLLVEKKSVKKLHQKLYQSQYKSVQTSQSK